MIRKNPVLHAFLLVALAILFSGKAFAQHDSAATKKAVDSSLVLSYQVSFDSLFLTSGKPVDTSLMSVSDVDRLSRSLAIYTTLTNTGLAYNNTRFEPVFNNGFDISNKAFEAYFVNERSIKYLIPVQPFTELYYTSGSKKEQQLNLSFGRELMPRFFVGMEFYLVNSPGPYKNSKSDNKSVSITARYHTVNERYAASLFYFQNKLIMQENGGITNDYIFTGNQETDRRIIPVNLTTAQNKVKESGFGFEQYFNLSAQPAKPDSLHPKKNRIQIGRITHRFSYHRNQMLFTESDPLAEYYADFDTVLDIEKTYDSVYQQVVKNSLQWNTLGYRKYNDDIPFYLVAGIEHAYIQHGGFTETLSHYTQLNPYAGIRIGLFKSAFLDGTARLITGKYSQGDLLLKARLHQYLGTKAKNVGSLTFSGELINQDPSWFFQQYSSNHFRWENQFSKSKFVTFAGAYSWHGFTGGVKWQVLDRYTYLNKAAMPQQFTGTTTLFDVYSNIDAVVGKFAIKGSFHYLLNGNDTLIHLPDFTMKVKVAFSQELFNRAAVLQPAIIYTYYTAYKADAYMPALRAFYLQDEKLTGGYPFIDVILGLKVKRANIFLKYANLFGLTGDYSYISVPHYPMRDPRFYFGVSWRFYQ